jgi:hypothetical protein
MADAQGSGRARDCRRASRRSRPVRADRDTANGATSIAGYDQLPAVRTGAVSVMDYVTAVALDTPSPLSIPYGLDAIRPALERVGAQTGATGGARRRSGA